MYRATTVAIIRAARFHISDTHHWNHAYAFYNDMILTEAETSIALLTACLMISKAFFRRAKDFTTSSAKGLLSSVSKNSQTKTQRIDSESNSINHEINSFDKDRAIRRTDRYDVGVESVEKSNGRDTIMLQNVRPWETADARV